MLLVALAVRGLALAQFHDAKLAGDETYYVYLAEYVASGLGHPSAWRPPLYPLFMGGVVALVPSLLAVRVVQIGLSVLGVALIYGVCERRFGRKAAVVSGLATALSPALVHYSHFLWSESLAAPLMAGFIAFLDRFDRSARLRDLALAGVLLGLLGLTKQVWVYFGAVVLAWLVGCAMRDRTLASLRAALRQTAPQLGVFALAMACVILPWTARNFAQSGQVVLVSMNKWFPIAMGNLYPDDEWFLGTTSPEDREALKSTVQHEEGLAYDAAWRSIALGLIRDHQPGWIVHKLVRGTVGLHNVRSQALRFLEHEWVHTGMLGFAILVATDLLGHYAVMIAGIAALWLVPGGRLKPLLVLAVLYLHGVHVIANATPRFIVPILPILTLYVGPLWMRGTEGWAAERWRWRGCIATVAAFVLIPLPRSLRTLAELFDGVPGAGS